MTAARAKPAVYDAAQQRRRSLLGRWHIVAKERGLDEETRRDRLQRSTGKRSAGDCTEAELQRAIADLSGRPTATPHRQLADSPHAKKARALWLSLWNLAVVRDPAEAALEAFALRQLGVERLQWSDPETADRLIEALKAMAERAGWRQRPPARTKDKIVWLKRELALAQGRRLGIDADPAFYLDHEPTLDRLIAERGPRVRAWNDGAPS